MTNRLMNKLRKNVDFLEAVRVLDELGLDYEVEAPRGKGHPIMRIGPVRWPVGTTPNQSMRVAKVRAGLRKRLRAAGLIPEQE